MNVHTHGFFLTQQMLFSIILLNTTKRRCAYKKLSDFVGNTNLKLQNVKYHISPTGVQNK